MVKGSVEILKIIMHLLSLPPTYVAGLARGQ